MSDKRSVHTDALATLGTIIDETAGRDAIHLAVEPAIAAVYLAPGQDVYFTEGKAYPNGRGKKVGIVDPFLKDGVEPGQRFWLIVYPRQITSLRHVWEHPDFPTEAVKPSPFTTQINSRSREWIERFAERYGFDYQTMMNAAEEYLNDGEYLTGGWEMEGESTPAEFWEHYQSVTGIKIKLSDSQTGNFFSCSC